MFWDILWDFLQVFVCSRANFKLDSMVWPQYEHFHCLILDLRSFILMAYSRWSDQWNWVQFSKGRFDFFISYKSEILFCFSALFSRDILHYYFFSHGNCFCFQNNQHQQLKACGMLNMAVWVVEFSNRGYKIKKIFA